MPQNEQNKQVPDGAIPGYEDTDQFEEDFLGVLLGEVRPVDMIKRKEGTQEALNVAHSCFCEECQEFLVENGEELVQIPYVEGLQA